MAISELSAAGTHHTDPLRHHSVGTTPPVDPSHKGRSSSEQIDDAGDRVEISERALAALADARKSEDLTFARTALDNTPSMSEERAAELLERIKSGYYEKADVLGQIADRVGDELKNGL